LYRSKTKYPRKKKGKGESKPLETLKPDYLRNQSPKTDALPLETPLSSLHFSLPGHSLLFASEFRLQRGKQTRTREKKKESAGGPHTLAKKKVVG